MLTAKQLSCQINLNSADGYHTQPLQLFSKLNFQVACGESLLVSGPNGSGKSTLLKILVGLNSDYTGNIDFARDDFGYLGHKNGLKEQLTVKENLLVYGALKTINKQVINNFIELLNYFNIYDYFSKPCRIMSQGQKRKLALCIVFSFQNKILFLDEPVVSLDKITIQKVANLLKNHISNKGIVIYTSHDKIFDFTPTKIISL